MHTVLIAEDEVLVRMGMNVSVPWEKYDMTVVGEAANGNQALELFAQKKPDVVITDLYMPGVDGMELIRRIRATGRPCAVIVVTCMDRFDLLKEAMDLDVVAYLVKATMSIAEIEKALEKAVQRLGSTGQEPDREDSVRQTQRRMMGDYVWHQTLTYEQFSAKAPLWGMPANDSFFMVCIVYTARCEMPWQLKRILYQMLWERMEPLQLRYLLQDDDVLLLLFSEKPDLDALQNVLNGYGMYMQDHFSVDMHITACTAPIPMLRLPSMAHVMRDCAMQSMGPELEIQWMDREGRLLKTQVEAALAHMRSLLWQTNDFVFARQAVHLTNQAELALYEGDNAFWDACARLARLLWQHQGLTLAEQTDRMQELRSGHTPAEALSLLCSTAVASLPRYRTEICRVIAHIVDHLECDLPLQESAAMIPVHPQYLSSLFKKEVGVGYLEFIHTVRIMMAQMMLKNGAWTTAQVAEKCGFSDTAYFNRRFKTMVGMTPGEWRRHG